jgi:hypothetical protein
MHKNDRVDDQVHHIEAIEAEAAKLSAFGDGFDAKVFDTEEKRHIPVNDPSLFPDGGLRAWSVVAASFLLVFCTFGYPLLVLLT